MKSNCTVRKIWEKILLSASDTSFNPYIYSHIKQLSVVEIYDSSLAQDKIDKVIYLMSDTQGVVSQSPEPRAHDKSV